MTAETKPSSLASKSRLVALAAGGFILGLLVIWLLSGFVTGRLSFGPPRFNGLVMQSSDRMVDFSLTAHTGEQTNLSDFRGQVVLLYFGYTYCPDVCPATLSTLNQAIEQLSERDRGTVQVLMITVDPERDTPEVLASYLPHFNDSFLGLTGTEEEIAAAATPFGIFYQKSEGTAASGYLVDHTASVAVVDQDGYLRLIFPFGTPADDIAADLRHLVRD